MADDDSKGEANENVSEDEKSKVEEELSKKLSTLIEQKEDDSKLLAEMIANPMIREILEASRSGKTLKLVEDDKGESSIQDLGGLEKSKVDLSSIKDLEDIPRREFAQVLIGQVSKALGPVLTKSLEPLMERVGTLEGHVDDGAKRDLDDAVAKARAKYKDFDNYKKEMLDLHKENRTLSVERLYILARTEKGDRIPASVDSERPDTSSGKPPRTRKREVPLARGRRGLDQLLEEAMEDSEVDLSKLSV